jgi:hypothetical protein
MIDVLVSTIMPSQPNVMFGGGGIPAATPEGNSAGPFALYVTPRGQVNLLDPGRVYGARINQVNVRFGKLLTAGGKRANTATHHPEPAFRAVQCHVRFLKPAVTMRHCAGPQRV